MKPLILLVLLFGLVAAGCKPSGNPPPTATTTPAAAESAPAVKAPFKSASTFKPAHKTTFDEVTAQLDAGGEAFAYLSAEQWLAGLSTNLPAWRKMLLGLPNVDDEARNVIEALFTAGEPLLRDSGLEQLTGLGYSSASLTPELSRTKFILHHYPTSEPGFLWKFWGTEPHDLTALGMFPANTALAAYGDADIAQLWETLFRDLSKCGNPDIEMAIKTLPAEFQKNTGLSWNKLIGSLGGELGFALTLDEQRKIDVPAGADMVTIPEPGLLLAVKVSDDTLYDFAVESLKNNPMFKPKTVTEPGLKMISMPIPLPIPIRLNLALARSGDYLFIASNPDLVRQAMATRDGQQKSVRDSDEFKQLAAYVPGRGNQFTFVSRRFSDTVQEIQKQAMRESDLGAEQAAFIQKLMGGSGPAYSLTVGAATPTGWASSSVGNSRPGQEILLAPVAVTATMAGLLLPALARAKAKANTINSVSNVKQIALGVRLWANDHDGTMPPAEKWCDLILKEVGAPKVFKAPNDSEPGRSSYGYNAALAGKKDSQVNPQTVMIFETDAGWNQSGGAELMLVRPRSGGSFVVGFVDGSVQMVPAAQINKLRWEP